jgi:hypothetical protein
VELCKRHRDLCSFVLSSSHDVIQIIVSNHSAHHMRIVRTQRAALAGHGKARASINVNVNDASIDI